ncbi:MAG TPA: hypothetical protein VHD31_01350 [Candidatus Paceibacterota bacterium]|nr:hypothetical protein [Candidatus Paceibacterota bacterium]
MKTSTVLGIVVVILIVLGGWYWWAHMPASPTTPEQGTTVNTNPNGSDYQPGNLLLGTDATTSLGTYLIASNGMTLYSFTKDGNASSTCYGQCAVTWPPYTVGDASYLSNIQAGVEGDVGSIVRADGSTQVTYNGHPLYFYAQDEASGDTKGQNVNSAWFVVKP